MFGCSSPAAARASRWNRRTTSSRRARCGNSTLTATSRRSSRVARAEHRRHAALAELVAELVATERVAGADLAGAAAGRRRRRGRGARARLRGHRIGDGGIGVVDRRGRQRRRGLRPSAAVVPRHAQLAGDQTTWPVLPAALACFIALPSRRPSSSAPSFRSTPSVCAIAATRCERRRIARQRRALGVERGLGARSGTARRARATAPR